MLKTHIQERQVIAGRAEAPFSAAGSCYNALSIARRWVCRKSMSMASR